MQKTAAKLEKLFFAFLLINPLLDVLSGAYIMLIEVLTGNSVSQFDMPLTPSLVLRMFFLLLFAFYALIVVDKKAILTMAGIGIAWAASVLGEFLFFYRFSLMSDLTYIVRFAYNVAVLVVYARVFQRCGLTRERLMQKLGNTFVFSLNLLSLAILIPYLFQVGYSTYADRFGYRGFRGFFYSGNDITAIMMSLLPICICLFMQLPGNAPRKKWIAYAAAPAFTLVAMCLIGTKTAFIGVGAAVGAPLVYALVRFFSKKERTPLIRLGVVLLIFALTLGFLMLFASANVLSEISESFNAMSDITEREGAATALLSGRQNKLKRAFDLYRKGGVYCILFGLGRGTQQYVIEMDVFEVILYYGVLGAAALLWLYVKLGVQFLIDLFRRFDLMGLCIAVSLALCAGYLVIAGHVLFSVSSGFYFAIILALSRLYYTPQPEELRIY